jgi:DNA-binding PadR family transcriptional regulator
VLEDAGYLQVRTGAVGRRPRTWFRLTAQGRQALEDHLAWLAQLEETVSASTRDGQQAPPPAPVSSKGATAKQAP